MKYILWLLKAAIFFTLFAFALNNQQNATVHFFFGTQWSAPQVLIVLTAFALGLVTGVLGMVPRWLKHRSAAQRAAKPDAAAAPATTTTTATDPTPPVPPLPPHDLHGI